jgi:hypothetical protein
MYQRNQKLLLKSVLFHFSQFLPGMYEMLISGEQGHVLGKIQFAEVTFYYTDLQLNYAVDSLSTMMSRRNSLLYVKVFRGHLILCSPPENHTGFFLFCQKEQNFENIALMRW